MICYFDKYHHHRIDSLWQYRILIERARSFYTFAKGKGESEGWYATSPSIIFTSSTPSGSIAYSSTMPEHCTRSGTGKERTIRVFDRASLLRLFTG